MTRSETGDDPGASWIADTDPAEHAAAVQAIRGHIAAGDVYQVNHTFRLRADLRAAPWTLFTALWNAHPVPHAAWMDLGGVRLASLSPELFFAVDGATIRCRPMKGTAARGRWSAEDEERRRALSASAKDRAENVMIVDMTRNDLGRLARPGSVRVTSLCEVEQYRSVFQMTSTVEGHSLAPPSEILRALFPCASITGAPKIRAMDVIADLERSPRGFYCGALGFVAPGRRLRFTVPIRTLAFDPASDRAEYGVGGGVVWDSTAAGEYEEARNKALVITRPDPPFELLETLRWRSGRVFLWDEHRKRLQASAAYFGFPRPDADALDRAVAAAAAAAGAPPAGLRLRLRYSAEGVLTMETAPLPRLRDRTPVDLALDDRPTDRALRWLYHKTTRRAVYDAARARFPDAGDVLLWNEAGELMEATIATVFVQLDGRWYTPPVDAGLLPGVLRERLLRRGGVRERRVTITDLRRAERILLANSVRGLRRAVLRAGDVARLVSCHAAARRIG